MKIYCSGIGGIGLSAYAALQAAKGHEVMGSDRSDSSVIHDLRASGVQVFLEQDGSHIPADTDLFVYSEAIPADAPERVRARELNLSSLSYFHALGDLSSDAFVIAVCGTHGKSSTTAMVARLLMETGKDPSVVVGTKMRELGGRNWRLGKSDTFVVEACEYRRSFHYISPDIVLMTNVDGDHFDAYASIEEYREAFVTFLRRLPQDGIVITHGSDADCRSVADASGKKWMDADKTAAVSVSAPGEHMRQNARLAAALAEHLEIGRTETEEALKGFDGTWRRMEEKGITAGGITVIDDYAHHPVEIRASLAGIREAHPGQKIICVFQPHTHDRTLKLYEDFTRAFRDADLVVIPDIYVARSDIETAQVDIRQFVEDIARESSTECRFGDGLQNTKVLLSGMLQSGEVLVTMGAGNVTMLSDEMLQ